MALSYFIDNTIQTAFLSVAGTETPDMNVISRELNFLPMQYASLQITCHQS